MSIEYCANRASEEQICDLLISCNEQFVPKLSEKVSIKKYSKKIKTNAINFEAWKNNDLLGLLAVYLNNEINSFVYITNISVQPEHMHKGIATRLLQNCLEYIKEKEFTTIKLEVNKSNIAALRLYHKFEFEVYEENNYSKFLHLKLK